MSNGLPVTRMRSIFPLSHTLLAAVLALLPLGLSADEAMPRIRVGLTKNFAGVNSLTLSSSQEFHIVDTSGECAPLNVSAGSKVEIALKDGCITVGTDGTQVMTSKGPIRLETGDQDQVVEVLSPEVRDKHYGGVIEITGGTKLTIVNELDLEHYLYGVIPVEVPASFHPEARKALAVAARTYVLRNSKRHRGDGYDICDSTHCQGYCGASRDAEWVRKTVDETRGQVIVHNGAIIYACYSADCGGVTQNGEDYSPSSKWPYMRSVVDNPSGRKSAVSSQPSAVSPEGPAGSSEEVADSSERPAVSPDPESPQSEIQNPKSKMDDYCAKGPNHTWNLTYKADELAAKLSAWQAKIGKFQTIEFAEFDSSDRVKTALLKGDTGECRITAFQLRDALGHSKMKSTRAVVSLSPEGSFVITGMGYGHGMGICMYGADGLARSREGVTYLDILKHYYTGVEVKAISDLGSFFQKPL